MFGHTLYLAFEHGRIPAWRGVCI